MSIEHTLIVVTLRGGADGLTLVPPLGDRHYFDARPGIAVAERDAIAIDGAFGLFGALRPLADLLAERALAIVHACGSDDTTRSHFEAQDRLEQAGASAGSAASGWIARWLAARPGPRAGALSAIAIGPRVPESLRGSPATAFESLAELVQGTPAEAELAALESLYDAGRRAPVAFADALADAAKSSLTALRELRALAEARPLEQADPGAFESKMALAADLALHADELGCEVIAIDHDGWDSHFASRELITLKAGELARGLSTFRERAAARWSRATVVVLSEFGRRVYENVSLGTDHGRGGCAFVAGGGLGSAGVVGPLPALSPDALEGPGDVPVRTDFRTLLSAVLERRAGLPNARLAAVFPGLVRDGESSLAF